MPGTKEGGRKAAETNLAKYGDSFYRQIGAKGGRNGRTGGFHYMKVNGQVDKIRAAGRKGGKISRRGESV